MTIEPNPSDTPNRSAEYVGDELELFLHAANWKSYWAAKIKPLIKEPVLEVGAGIGSNLSLLRTKNQDWFALEPDSAQAATITRAHSLDEKLEVKSGFVRDLDPTQRFNTILYIDVLEHIEHDADELSRVAAHLNPEGKLIVLSPAHNTLYSNFDKAVGHFRRYNKKMLKALTPPQLQIEQLYYLDSIGCAASFANAKILRSDMPTKKQILFWDRIMIPVSKIIDKFSFHLIGKTIVVVWKKS